MATPCPCPAPPPVPPLAYDVPDAERRYPKRGNVRLQTIAWTALITLEGLRRAYVDMGLELEAQRFEDLIAKKLRGEVIP
jgi:hypothetical protein